MTPTAAKAPIPPPIDTSALNHEKIYISAGVRGQQIILAPSDLIKATEAETVDLVLE